MSSSLPRRCVLLGGAAIAATAVTGCPGGDDRPGSGASGSGSDTGHSGNPGSGGEQTTAAQAADLRLLSAVLADQRNLLERIRRTVRAHPALLARLRPALSNSVHHVDALEQAGPSHRVRTRPVQVPSSTTQAMDELRAHLERAARDRVADCLEARSGAFARLLASVAAGLAQEAVIVGTES